MLTNIDTALFHLVNSGLKSRFMDYLMPMFISYSDWYLLIAVSLLILLYQDRKKGTSFIILTILTIAITDGAGFHILKPLFGRIRPCNILPPDTFNLMAGCSNSFSFPSQHAANLFAAAAVVIHHYRKAAPYAILVAAMVALSRVYVGVHYPIDVIGGALIGYLFGLGVLRVSLKIKGAGNNRPDGD